MPPATPDHCLTARAADYEERALKLCSWPREDAGRQDGIFKNFSRLQPRLVTSRHRLTKPTWHPVTG
jgi:hypothetical protein